ncbi:hypothetical protein [Burkholderia pseudomallei]|uniref:hypothetical protein n=1 Tax=Burkholderia pseudomallei TaxID=28450 RepID=UPI001EF2082F|nr:hypothetical protein [Burkholderia pseudomallei]
MQPMQSAAACDFHRFVNLPTVVQYESFGCARAGACVAVSFPSSRGAVRASSHRSSRSPGAEQPIIEPARHADAMRTATARVGRAAIERPSRNYARMSSGHRAAVRPAGSHRVIRDVVFSHHRRTPRHPLSRTNSAIAHAAPSRFSTSNPKPKQSGLTRITSRINGIFTKTILNNPNEYPEKFNASGAAAPARAAHRTAAHRTQPSPA